MVGGETQHRWTSVRHIDPDGRTTDVVHCENCGLQAVWTNVDPGSEVPRSFETEVSCKNRIANEVMNT